MNPEGCGHDPILLLSFRRSAFMRGTIPAMAAGDLSRRSGARSARHTEADGLDNLRRWIADHRRVFVLTGAGCSTASGIPDYRDEQRRVEAAAAGHDPGVPHAGRDLPPLLGARLRRLAALHSCRNPAPRITRLPHGSVPDRLRGSSRRTSTACISVQAAAR